MYANCLTLAYNTGIISKKEMLIMANTASVYARIDPELKSDVDEILSQLGLTPSAVVQMLYSQIKLTRGIPFSVRLPERKPLSMESLTKEQLDAELQKGYDAVLAGKTYTADEVDKILQEEYGI
jgi:DNA-damage-inducible protein J